jgi:hypothetical protein
VRSPALSWFQSGGFWIRLRSLWSDPFRLAARRDDLGNLPAYLLRDIGMNERHGPDWKREVF